MRNISYLALTLLYLQVPTTFSAIPCPLIWQGHFGSEKMPENPIGPIAGAPDTAQFASRVWNAEYHGGWMQKSVSYYPLDATRAASSGDYELLTNPNECLIKWVDNSEQAPEDADKLTPIDATGSKVVGRALIGNSIHFGEVVGGVLLVSTGGTSTTRLTR